MVTERNDVYIITGEDDFLRESELKKIINKFSARTNNLFASLEKTTKSYPAKKSFLTELIVETFYAEDSDVLKILSSAATHSFSQRKKIIVVKNVERFDSNQKKQLFNFLSQPTLLCLFIIIIKNKAQALKFYSEHKNNSELIHCDSLYGSKLSKWIYKKTKEKNINISPDTIELLKEKIGNNLWVINDVLEQLSIYAKDYLQVTPSLVKKFIGKSVKYSVFSLVEKIADKNLKDSLEIYQTLLNERTDFLEIIGILSWQLRRLWQAKQLIEKSKDRYQICKILNIRYFENKFFSALKNFNMCDLKNAIKELAVIDLEIKTGRKESSEAIQLFIIRLCKG